MKPFTQTITAEESAIVYRALSKGLFCANQLHSIGTIGAPEYIRQIEAAMQIMNRPLEGGHETEQESNAGYMASVAAECSLRGSD